MNASRANPFCYVMEVGYPNGEAERAHYETQAQALGDLPYYGEVTYVLISRVRCERSLNEGFNAVKWLEKPPTIRFGADPIIPQPHGQSRKAERPS